MELTKLLRVMKLTAFVLFCGCFSVTANGLSQSVTLNVKDASMKKVFTEIKRQTGYVVFYDYAALDEIKPVTLMVKNVSVEKLLTECFSQQPLDFTIESKTIMVVRKKTIPTANQPTTETTLSAPPIEIKGRVTDEEGSPLPGVSVVIKGTQTGSTSDANGNYSISVPENSSKVLVFSFVGMEPQEVTVSRNATTSIKLIPVRGQELEIVVKGYGTQKRVNLTGSVATIGGDKLANRPVTNISTALQGQLPGVAVVQQSGQPGKDNGVIKIRGIGTMNNSSPMVVVDGLIASMEDLNPNDIESISVLKDASAGAIYGSRAANGVILITTKRGKTGAAKVTYSGYAGFQKRTDTPEWLNSYDFAKLFNEGLVNEGQAPRYTDEEIEKFRTGSDPEHYPNTDWDGLYYSRKGLQQSHNVSVSGGTESARYLLSLGYLDQEGLVKKVNSKRYNLRFNLDSKISDRLTAGITSTFSRQLITEPTAVPPADLQIISINLNRIPPTFLNKYPDGSWARHIDGNPIAWVEDGGIMSNIVSRALGDVFAELTLAEGLTLKGSAGLDFNFGDISTHIKDLAYGDGTYQGPNQLTNTIKRSTRTILQTYLTYKKDFVNHHVTLLAGASREAYRYDEDGASRKSFPSNELTELNAGSQSSMTNFGTMNENNLRSYFGRVNYSFKGKYLLEGTVRYDGSSKFAADTRWGLFPSVSAGWRISEESFFKNVSFVNNLKVRASYGSVGNNNTNDYQTLATISLGQNYPFGGAINSGAAQVLASNPLLQWEKSTTFEIGVDAGFFNEKITFTGNYYDRFTEDILITVPVSLIYGLPAPTVNTGAMRNKGVEFQIAHTNRVGDFTYNTSFNIAFNKSKVERFPNPVITTKLIQKEGMEWNSFYGYEYLGNYKTEDEVANLPKVAGAPVKLGDLYFKDQNGDKVINAADRKVLGSDQPGITFGFNLGFGYKNFDLSIFGQGAADVNQALANNIVFPFINGYKAQQYHLDRWTPETPNGKYPRTHVLQGYNYATYSSFSIVNADYLRLKNLQIGYTFPGAVTRLVKADHIRLYVSGQNLLTLSGVNRGFDPEGSSQTNALFVYPNVKVFTAGVNVRF